jgi:uncharacterized protein YegL
MPRLLDDSMEIHNIGTGAFSFSGTRVEHLGATEYTLVTVAVDETGSVIDFQDELREMLITAVEACKRSPRSDNLLVRVITFNDTYDKGTNEIHGFRPLAEIDTTTYEKLHPGGRTPLYDACYSAIGASNAYAKQLSDDDFGVNGIVFVITDGANNVSSATANMVKEEAEKSVKGEVLESMVSVLIGINAAAYRDLLERFHKEAGLTQYVDAGEVTTRRLARLAEFVSTSVSSQSQALGTGGPSQQISATI